MNTKGKVQIRGLFFSFLLILFGITLARGMYSGDVRSICIAVVSLIFLAVLLLVKKKWKVMLVFVAMFFVGNGLFFAAIALREEKVFFDEVAVVGRVDDQAYMNGPNQRVILKDVKVNGEKVSNLSLTIFLNEEDGVKSGDMLSFSTNITTNSLFQYKEFNTYFFRNNIGYSAVVSKSQIVVSDGHLNADEKYRLYVKGMLEKAMDEDYANVCYAVLFGDKSEVPQTMKYAYNDSGIIHILTVSGLHIGFFIALLHFFLKRCKLNRFVNFGIIFAFLLIYCYLCGFAPAVVRASVMGIVLLAANLGSRRYDRLTSLGAAGIVILLFSPLSGLDIGFLMSFFAVATIFFVGPPLKRLLCKIFPTGAAGYIAVTISAQLGILPFATKMISSYNLLAVFTNLLVLPIFAIVFPLLIISIILCSIMPFISLMLIIFKYPFQYIFGAAKFFSTTKVRISISPLETEIVVFFYMILFSISSYFMTSRLVKSVFVSGGIFLIVLSSALNLIPVKIGGGIVDIVNLNYTQSVVLTNKSGQRLICGNVENEDWQRYLKFNKGGNIDFLVCDGQLTGPKNDFIDAQKTKFCLVLDKAHSSRQNIIEVEYDKFYQLGDFYVRYISTNNHFIGFEIFFADTSIFIAPSEKLRYNVMEEAQLYLSSQNYTMAVLGKNYALEESICEDALVISQKGGGDFNYQKDGNIRLQNINGIWKGWRID